MSTSARVTNYSEARETRSKSFNSDTLDKTDRQAYVISGTVTKHNEVERSGGCSYRGLESPSRAKVVRMEFENVPNAARINTSTSSLERSSEQPKRTYVSRQILSAKGNATTHKFTSSYHSTMNRNELEDSRQDDKHRDKTLPGEGSEYVRSNISAASSSADKSSRVKPIDRNHRSVTTTSSLGVVTATKTQVPSRLDALREDFAANRRGSSETVPEGEEVGENRNSHRTSEGGQSKPGRRRRRPAPTSNVHSESTTTRKNFPRNSAFNDSEKVKSPASVSRKFSPYPNYIQPVTEGPSYRRQVNRIPSHDTGSSPYSHRNRKISTDMNRYVSSSSKSSSSESEDGAISRANTLPKSKNLSRIAKEAATPDTSDCEGKVGVRTRRGPRKLSRMPPAANWDDPHVISLPDNYKQPEAFSSRRSPRTSDSSSTRRNSQTQVNNSTTAESSREKRSEKNNSKEPSDTAEYRGRNRRGNRLNINETGVEENIEGLGNPLSPSRNADISLSTPDLARVDRQTSGSNEISTSSVYRKPSESGDSENCDVTSPGSQSNNVVQRYSSIEQVKYEVIQQQPKIKARKVGQDYWPRDEDTKRLLTHTPATSERSQSPEATVVSHSAASCAMQETIDQLQSFVNETGRHRPLASDRSKSLETVAGTASQSYASFGRSSNKFSGLHGQQSSKTTSPHMSSTETLKEVGSSGEYQDKNSRSPSFDSTASNPEFGGINSYVVQRPGKEITRKSENLGHLQEKSVSADDLSLRRDGTSTLKKLHDLTEAMKNIKMPQPSNSQSVTPTDSISTVSSPNSISNSQTKLETLNEYPEPLSPPVHKRTGSKNGKGISKQEFTSGDSLEIDEGVVTDEVQPDESLPFKKFTSYVGKPPKRITNQIESTNQSDINEPRSRSDPSAERKRLQPNKSIDRGLLNVLRSPHEYGSSGQSLGGSSQNSEQQSLFSDTLNIEEEEKEDELKQLQSKEKMKEKSRSDPNPEVLLRLDSENADKNNGYDASLGPASSEPNGLEQTDILAPLDRFQQHPTGTDALHVRVAPSMRRHQRNSSSKDGQTPTSRQSLSSSQDSESSSPVQKQEEEIMFQEFDRVFKGMKSSKEQNVKTAVAHTRSSSEPVDNVDYTQPRRYATSSPYGGSTFNLPKQPVRRNTEDQGFVKDNFSPDKRLHVFENLLDTEKSYVTSLRILYQDYMTPLKHTDNYLMCEPRLVDEIFYKIPQLLQHHEKFYNNVEKCHHDWNTREIKLGELFLNSFNKDALLDTYTAYIANYFNAREAVRTANAKESFRRFLEQCRSKDKDKYSLADLMIKPVQRIPRYELLIKDMLKHTPLDHPDREGLLLAQQEIHKLADQMNKSEKAAERTERQDRLLNEVEQLIEGCVDLCFPKRRFLRQDIVSEISSGSAKKDRSLWLFNDLIVCSTRKARAGNTFRRGSINNLYFGQDRTPNIDPGFKYKFLWKFPLEDVDKFKGGSSSTSRPTSERQVQILQNDLEHLTTIQQTAAKIETFHSQLDDAVREMMLYLERQLSDKRLSSIQRNFPPGRLELGVSTTEGMKTFLFEFAGDDKVQFERELDTAKRNLTSFKSRWEPSFMKAIPITKERSGMQFSCAAANVDGSPECKEVWVCNTDGSVGQVCILALEPTPSQTRCITVCDARIYCIAQVPIAEKRFVPAHVILNEMVTGVIVQPPGPAQEIMSWDDDLEESDAGSTSPHGTLSNYSSPHSQSPSNTVNGGDDCYPIMSPLIDSPFLRRRFGFGRLDRQLAASQPAIYRPLPEKSDHSSYPNFTFGNGGKDSKSQMDSAFRMTGQGSLLHGSLNDLLQEEENMSSELIAGMDAMWLGSDDGMIHIFPSSQSTRTSKNCVKRSLNAPVYNILYHNGQVFVSLSNGELLVYTRDLTNGQWDLDNYRTKPEKSPRAITKMVVVGGKELWCGCQNMIKIIDIKDLSDIDSITVSNDPKKQVFCMVSSGYGVWVALDKRPQIKLYHSITHEVLADVDVSSPVSKMLASADAIIRQHKAACLRITALLVCNGLLWLGTSAGVVLTVTLPKITPSTSALAMPVIPQGLAYGHTGHVRFLACAEIPDKDHSSFSRGSSRRTSANANKRRSSSSNALNQPKTVSIIISGGDGYEDFRMNSDSESAGREDSINHLLVWRA